MDINEYVALGLVHSIHTSGRRSFRGCRRRWDWTYNKMMYPRVTPPPLEFGVAFHKAMENYYEPSMWGVSFEAQQGLALHVFKEECDKQLKEYRRMNGEPEVDVLNEYKERVTLGLNMIRHYTSVISPQFDLGFRPVEVEVPFEVPIQGPMGEIILCKCDQCWNRWVNWASQHDDLIAVMGTDSQVRTNWQGLPVTYGGRLDMLAKDDIGRYWIFDWKEETLDSPILTPNGWVKMGDLKIGDFVIGSNGKPTKVIGVYPKGEHEVYEVEFRDGTIVECSKDHAWYVKDYFGKFSIKESQDIKNAPTYQRYSVPLPTGPVEFDKPDEQLVMHPYVLGSLIGDGCFTGNVLAYSSQSGETVKLLKQYVTDGVNITDQRHHGSNKWKITGPWKQDLIDLGLWGKYAGEKFIPQEYLFASVEDRILLLQGLMDTDGNTGIYRFTSTSNQLAEDFRHLVWSLGGNANLNVSKERLHQNGTTINVPQYGVNFWLPDWIEVNQLERKRVGRVNRSRGLHRSIKEVRATGVMKEMQCIRVEANDHLYMTNNFILTHNTTSRMLDEGKEEAFLELDDQVASYVWALRHGYNIPVAGFVYVEIRKAYPLEPEELKRPYKGKKFSTNKQVYTTFQIAHDTFATKDSVAFEEGLYNDYLNWLQTDGPRFHQRHQIHKNDYEIDQIGKNIYLEALDIVNNPRIYPTPGRFSCPSCLFRQPCLGMNQGEDYEYTLDTLFEKRNKHYYEEKEPSTE